MNLSKPVNPIRHYAFRSVITALILFSPVFAFLAVIATEILIDLLMVGGTGGVCVVAAGGIGWVLSRKFWRRPEVLHQSEPKLLTAYRFPAEIIGYTPWLYFLLSSRPAISFSNLEKRNEGFGHRRMQDRGRRVPSGETSIAAAPM
jgi:hypothetical protein